MDIVDSVQAIYFNHARDVSGVSAIDKVHGVYQELETLSRSVPREMVDFHSPDPESPGRLLALDTAEGEMALFKFRLCLLYHNIRILATLPLLSYLVWQDVTKQPFTVNQQAVRIAAECVSSAESTVRPPYHTATLSAFRLNLSNCDAIRSRPFRCIWLKYRTYPS